MNVHLHVYDNACVRFPHGNLNYLLWKKQVVKKSLGSLVIMEDDSVSLFTFINETKLSGEFERIERFGVWRMKKSWEKVREMWESFCDSKQWNFTNDFQPLEMKWMDQYIDLNWLWKMEGNLSEPSLVSNFTLSVIFFKRSVLEGNHNSFINNPMRMGFFALDSCYFYEYFAKRTALIG